MGQDAFDRARDVRRAVPGGVFWDEHSVLAVGIEDPRGYGSGSLYRVQGAILSRIPAMTLVKPWIPSQWRKTVGLPGNASKEVVGSFVRTLHSLHSFGPEVLTWPQDACDAYCIALATRSLLEIGEAA